MSVTDVHSFLGTAGVGRKWIHGFSLIAKPLMLLLKTVVQQQSFFSKEAEDAQNEPKCLVLTVPVLVKQDYKVAKLLLHQDLLPQSSERGLVIVAVDSWKLSHTSRQMLCLHIVRMP